MIESGWWCSAVDRETRQPCREPAEGPGADAREHWPMGYWVPVCRRHRNELLDFSARCAAEERWQNESCGSQVYVAQRGQAFKVGVATNVQQRLVTLACETDATWRPTMTAGPLVLLTTTRGIRDDEQALHNALRDWHVGGEWFTFGFDSLLATSSWLSDHRKRHHLKGEFNNLDSWLQSVLQERAGERDVARKAVAAESRRPRQRGLGMSSALEQIAAASARALQVQRAKNDAA